MADVMSLAFQLWQVTGSPYFEALLVYLGQRHYGGSESDWAYWLFCRRIDDWRIEQEERLTMGRGLGHIHLASFITQNRHRHTRGRRHGG